MSDNKEDLIEDILDSVKEDGLDDELIIDLFEKETEDVNTNIDLGKKLYVLEEDKEDMDIEEDIDLEKDIDVGLEDTVDTEEDIVNEELIEDVEENLEESLEENLTEDSKVNKELADSLIEGEDGVKEIKDLKSFTDSLFDSVKEGDKDAIKESVGVAGNAVKDITNETMNRVGIKSNLTNIVTVVFAGVLIFTIVLVPSNSKRELNKLRKAGLDKVIEQKRADRKDKTSNLFSKGPSIKNGLSGILDKEDIPEPTIPNYEEPNSPTEDTKYVGMENLSKEDLDYMVKNTNRIFKDVNEMVVEDQENLKEYYSGKIDRDELELRIQYSLTNKYNSLEEIREQNKNFPFENFKEYSEKRVEDSLKNTKNILDILDTTSEKEMDKYIEGYKQIESDNIDMANKALFSDLDEANIDYKIEGNNVIF